MSEPSGPDAGYRALIHQAQRLEDGLTEATPEYRKQGLRLLTSLYSVLALWVHTPEGRADYRARLDDTNQRLVDLQVEQPALFED